MLKIGLIDVAMLCKQNFLVIVSLVGDNTNKRKFKGSNIAKELKVIEDYVLGISEQCK